MEFLSKQVMKESHVSMLLKMFVLIEYHEVE